MTNEEAIKILQDNSTYWGEHDADKFCKAYEMAIEALKAEPCIAEDGTLIVKVEDGSKISRVLVCGDNHFGGLYYPEGGGE